MLLFISLYHIYLFIINSFSICRLRTVIEKLNFELGGMQEKMKSLSDISVNQILVSSNLSDPQKILIQEIFKTSQHKNKKNRRYSEDWILLCILLKIR